jgi:hypothetical protein
MGLSTRREPDGIYFSYDVAVVVVISRVAIHKIGVESALLP